MKISNVYEVPTGTLAGQESNWSELSRAKVEKLFQEIDDAVYVVPEIMTFADDPFGYAAANVFLAVLLAKFRNSLGDALSVPLIVIYDKSDSKGLVEGSSSRDPPVPSNTSVVPDAVKSAADTIAGQCNHRGLIVRIPLRTGDRSRRRRRSSHRGRP
jgi:hypothetical protein